MIRRRLLAAFVLLACAAPALASSSAATPAHRALAGVYRLHGGPDAVSELVLLANGRFRFGFSAGALDLVGQGRWTSDGRSVILNSEPRPVPPVFSAGPVTRSADGRLTILVNGPGGRGLALVDLRVGFADGHVVEGYTQDYGWQPQEFENADDVRWAELSLRMYGLPPQRFALDPRAGNNYAFTLTPNGLGTQDFHDTVLPITREGLVLSLLGGSSTYVRVGPRR